jgi:hypothetical protein
MDHHAMMWDAATRDLASERQESALVHALADLSGVRDFTHIAADRHEYGHRAALAADRITEVAAAWGVSPDLLREQLDTSFVHVLAVRTAAAQKLHKSAAAAPAEPAAPQPPPEAPGAPVEALGADTAAKTSKPRTLPSGGAAATVMPAPVAPGVAPAPAPMSPPGPAAPGAQAAPRVASRRDAIAADIAALNPQLPEATIARLASSAMRHLAAEPLAYGNWDNAPDGPVTRSVKNWNPGHPGQTGHDGGPATAAPHDGGTDGPTPAGPSAAGIAADTAPPAAASVLEEAASLAAAAAAR